MDEREKAVAETRNDDQDESIFAVEEISVEELLIDGICGVY
ncbi:MAG: mycofactocin precursor MftA [Thermodesulfobacteriota bacterium]